MLSSHDLPARPAPDDPLIRALSVLRCPACGGDLVPASDGLECPKCRTRYARDRVLRFVDRAAYAESFGLQWKTFPRVQMDGTLVEVQRLTTATVTSGPFPVPLDPAELPAPR